MKELSYLREAFRNMAAGCLAGVKLAESIGDDEEVMRCQMSAEAWMQACEIVAAVEEKAEAERKEVI